MDFRIDAELVQKFSSICCAFQLRPSFVLQTFADSISVSGFLDPYAEKNVYLASKVMLDFSKNYTPVLPLNPFKRERSIHSIQGILKVLNSPMQSDRESALHTIEDKWYRKNKIEGTGTRLHISMDLSVQLSKGLLLECDMFRCLPENLLGYFMTSVVNQMEIGKDQAPAIQFLLYCFGLNYPEYND